MPLREITNPHAPRMDRDSVGYEHRSVYRSTPGYTNPGHVLRQYQDSMERPSGQADTSVTSHDSGIRMPHVDVSEDSKEWCIEADLPGVRVENVDVRVQNSHLIVSASLHAESQEPASADYRNERRYHRRERFSGYFERIFPLPDNVDKAAIHCDFRDGVLCCHLPKLRDPAPAHHVPITVGDSETLGAANRPTATEAKIVAPGNVPEGSITNGAAATGKRPGETPPPSKTGTLIGGSRSAEKTDESRLSQGEPLS